MPGVKGRCGGTREGAGRKPLGDEARVFMGARVSAKEREWLAQWGDTDTAALGHLLERAMKFWPDGPYRAGATKNRKRKR
jgi:hypothetical protein